MRAHCPKCGSVNVRYSRIRSLREFLARLVGIRAMRCRVCSERFMRGIWRISALRYAHCPRCLNMDLGYWSTRDYRPSWKTKLLLRLGAKPLRCGCCRCRFTSFRPRKPHAHTSGGRQVYSWE